MPESENSEKHETTGKGFGFHHTIFFMALRGQDKSDGPIIWVGMTQVWSEEVRTLRWKSKYDSGIAKGGFTWSSLLPVYYS